MSARAHTFEETDRLRMILAIRMTPEPPSTNHIGGGNAGVDT
jgi:hypothetical protein